MTENEILIRLADFGWSRAQKKDFIDILNSISNGAAGETQELSQRVTTLETALSTANGKISTLESSVATLQETVQTLQQQLTTANETIGTLQTNVTSLTEQMGTANQNIAQLQEDVAALQGGE